MSVNDIQRLASHICGALTRSGIELGPWAEQVVVTVLTEFFRGMETSHDNIAQF